MGEPLTLSVADPRTIAGRLELLMSWYGVSGRALSRRAGLHELHIGQFMARARRDARHSLSVETIAAIAKAAGVRAGWLAFGEGEP